MNTNNISQYLAMIKRRGLAVNNLYMVEIGLPTALESYAASTYLSGYVNQVDTNQTISNSNMLTGIVNVDKYKTGAKNIASKLGFGKDQKSAKTKGGGVNYSGSDKVCVLCVAAELPFYKQKVNNAFYNHMTHKMVTGLDTDPINLTFYIDRNNIVLTMFEAWQSLINGTHTEDGIEGMVSYKDEYAATDLTISLINKSYVEPSKINSGGELEKFHSTILKGAFPSFINPIRVNNGTSELLQLQVTMEYDKIRHESFDLTSLDPQFEKEIATGFNLLDMKNKLGDAISEGKNMVNSVRNDVKSASSNVNDIVKTGKNLFK